LLACLTDSRPVSVCVLTCIIVHDGVPLQMSGAATSPHVGVFVRAAAQVKKAMDVTHRLGGDNFNFWGGREGYSYLPTTVGRCRLTLSNPR